MSRRVIIVNSDRIIAALIRNSTSRRILLSEEFQFATIGLAKTEIKRHEVEILLKANLAKEGLSIVLSVLFSRITLVDESAILESNIQRARSLMDKIDPDDTPFIALALSIKNDGIWTEEGHFYRQNLIRILRTSELLKSIGE